MMKRKLSIGFITALIIVCLMIPAAAFAKDDGGSKEPAKAKRTILMYVCGSNLETNYGMASFNLRQILDSKFSHNGDVNFIIMTGGANMWQLEQDYLIFPTDGPELPDDAVINDKGEKIEPTSGISNCYNQIWEAKGKDAAENAGKIVLLDGDGVTSEQPVKSEEELMSDPGTLKAFINYGVAHYPAEKYDLILWDHDAVQPHGGDVRHDGRWEMYRSG